MPQSLEASFCEAVRDSLCLCAEDAVSPDMIWEADLVADSLDMVDVVARLEDEFDISISEAETPKVTDNVGKLLDLVRDKVSGKEKPRVLPPLPAPRGGAPAGPASGRT